MPTATVVDRPATPTTLRITLPAGVLAEYETQAAALNVAVEDLISVRLLACADHTSAKPLYFSDAQRQQLESILGKNLKSTGDALDQIRSAMSVRLEKVVISLKMNLLHKLKSRCLGMPWEKFLEETIVQQLERYVGIR